MTHKTLAAALFSLLFAACSDTPAPPPGAQIAPVADTPAAPPAASAPRGVAPPPAPPALQTLRGLYRSGAAGDFFYDCAAAQTYRVGAKPRNLDSLYQQACQPAPYEDESVYAAVRGYITPTPGAAAAGELNLTGIDTISAKTMFNTCLAYDFWCLGTEPFWGLLISEKEGGLFLKNIGEDRGRRFAWAPPKTTANSWTYTVADPVSGEKATVIVRKTPCSDGMSDRRYNYSADIRIGNMTLKGCAIRYGEAVKRE